MNTLRWNALPAAEREELQALMRSKAAHSTEWQPSTDWLGFMILALPAAIAGGVALGMSGIGASFEYIQALVEEFGFVAAIRLTWHQCYFVIPFALAVWLTVFTVRNWKRRGIAVTSFATVKVLGPKVKLVRHEDVVRAALTVFRSAKGSWTALELFDRHGAKTTFYTHGLFAIAAVNAINRGRAEPVPLTEPVRSPQPELEAATLAPGAGMPSTHPGPSDRLLGELEELAALVDRLESAGEEATAFAKRQRLLIEFEVSNLLPGTPALAARLEAYPHLRTYRAAAIALAAYQGSSERRRLLSGWPEFDPARQHVSLDWFRQPSAGPPPGHSPHDWLALCERNFCDPLPGGTGTRFVRLAGSMYALSYRREVDAEPRLVRADAEGVTAAPPPRVYTDTAQATDGLVIAGVAALMADWIELTQESGAVEPVVLPFTCRGRPMHLGFAPSPSRPDRFHVELTIRHSASGTSGQSQVLEQGGREELIAFLRRPQVVADIEEAAEQGILVLARSDEPIDMHFGG